MANKNRVFRAQTPLEQIVDLRKIGQLTQLPQDQYMALSQKAENEEFNPAADDYKTGNTVCLIVVDWQNDFIEGPMAHLGVEGSREDSERLFKFIHQYMGGITTILSTVDTHNPQSIFFPTWWINPKTYENPGPFTTIMAKDIEDGIWMPRFKDPQDKSRKKLWPIAVSWRQITDRHLQSGRIIVSREALGQHLSASISICSGITAWHVAHQI